MVEVPLPDAPEVAAEELEDEELEDPAEALLPELEAAPELAVPVDPLLELEEELLELELALEPEPLPLAEEFDPAPELGCQVETAARSKHSSPSSKSRWRLGR